MPLGLTPLHLVIILIIALIVVGPGKLPEVGSALGKTIREFRKASTDDALVAAPANPPEPAAPEAPSSARKAPGSEGQ